MTQFGRGHHSTNASGPHSRIMNINFQSQNYENISPVTQDGSGKDKPPISPKPLFMRFKKKEVQANTNYDLHGSHDGKLTNVRINGFGNEIQNMLSHRLRKSRSCDELDISYDMRKEDDAYGQLQPKKKCSSIENLLRCFEHETQKVPTHSASTVGSSVAKPRLLPKPTIGVHTHTFHQKPTVLPKPKLPPKPSHAKQRRFFQTRSPERAVKSKVMSTTVSEVQSSTGNLITMTESKTTNSSTIPAQTDTKKTETYRFRGQTLQSKIKAMKKTLNLEEVVIKEVKPYIEKAQTLESNNAADEAVGNISTGKVTRKKDNKPLVCQTKETKTKGKIDKSRINTNQETKTQCMRIKENLENFQIMARQICKPMEGQTEGKMHKTVNGKTNGKKRPSLPPPPPPVMNNFDSNENKKAQCLPHHSHTSGIPPPPPPSENKASIKLLMAKDEAGAMTYFEDTMKQVQEEHIGLDIYSDGIDETDIEKVVETTETQDDANSRNKGMISNRDSGVWSIEENLQNTNDNSK